MKTTLFLFSLLLASTAFGQAPRTEFALQLSENTVNVKPGETRQVDIRVLRSKAFAKGKIEFGTASVLPKGITVRYEQSEGNLESTVASISVDASVVPNTYQVVLNGTMYNKTKGSIVKLVVGSENVASK